MEKKIPEKQSFRQRWLPTMNDADEAAQKRGWHDLGGLMIFGGRYLKTIATAILLTYSGYQAIGNNMEYSNGTRAGVINKFSHKGYIWKTYEGEMALEGIVSTGTTTGANVWDFSLDDSREHGENIDKLAEDINRYLGEGKKVKVTYIEPWKTWPWRSGTDHLVQSVEPIENKEK